MPFLLTLGIKLCSISIHQIGSTQLPHQHTRSCRFLGRQGSTEGSLHLPGHCLGSCGCVQALCHSPVHRLCLWHCQSWNRHPRLDQAGRLLFPCSCCGSLHLGGMIHLSCLLSNFAIHLVKHSVDDAYSSLSPGWQALPLLLSGWHLSSYRFNWYGAFSNANSRGGIQSLTRLAGLH